MARKLAVRRRAEPYLDELSSDAEGSVFGQPITNQLVPTGYPTLPNPNPAPFDRKKMPPSRAEAFGFQERPDNINDLEVGNAGAGVSSFRRAQFYSRIADSGAAFNADRFVYNIPIAIATARSADTRPRFFHVSFLGVSALSGDQGLPAGPPLSESQILSTAGIAPSNTVLKGRVQVYDESGSRFFDVNIHGTSSFSVYAWGISTFILLPSLDGEAQGAEVDVQNLSNLTLRPGLIENTLATGRIIPIFQNATQITDQVTRTVSIPSGAAGGTGAIPIPPGARAVRIRANIGVAPGALSPVYRINFSVAPSPIRTFAMGRIFLLPGRLESALMAVPNATFIAFDAGPLDPAVEWIATFVIEA